MISVRLGTTDCIAVSDEYLIHQVLIERGEFFDARPNFLRFHLMFGGSKQNGNIGVNFWGNFGGKIGGVVTGYRRNVEGISEELTEGF